MGPMRDVLKLGTDVAGEDGHDVGLLGRQLFPNQPEWLAFGNPLTKIADGGASTIIGTLGDPAPDLKTRMAHKWVVVACDTSSDGRVVAALVRETAPFRPGASLRQQLVICDSWAGSANRTVLLRNETEISGLSLSFAGDWFVGVIHKGDPEDVKAWSSRSGDELGMAIQDAMGSVFEELAKEGFDAVVHSVAWSPVEDRMVVALLCLDTEGVRKIALVSVVVHQAWARPRVRGQDRRASQFDGDMGSNRDLRRDPPGESAAKPVRAATMRRPTAAGDATPKRSKVVPEGGDPGWELDWVQECAVVSGGEPPQPDDIDFKVQFNGKGTLLATSKGSIIDAASGGELYDLALRGRNSITSINHWREGLIAEQEICFSPCGRFFLQTGTAGYGVAAGTFALVTVWDLEAVAGPENMGAIQIHHDDWLVLTRARGRALVTSKGAVILLVTTDTGTHVMVWGMETLKRRIEFKDVGSTILPTNSFPLPEQPVMTPDGVPCAYLHQNDQPVVEIWSRDGRALRTSLWRLDWLTGLWSKVATRVVASASGGGSDGAQGTGEDKPGASATEHSLKASAPGAIRSRLRPEAPTAAEALQIDPERAHRAITRVVSVGKSRFAVFCAGGSDLGLAFVTRGVPLVEVLGRDAVHAAILKSTLAMTVLAVTLERPPIDTPSSAKVNKKKSQPQGQSGQRKALFGSRRPGRTAERVLHPSGSGSGDHSEGASLVKQSTAGSSLSGPSTISALHFPGLAQSSSIGHSSDSAGAQIYKIRGRDCDALLRATGFEVVVVDLLMRSKRTIFCVADLDPAAEAILATEPSSGAGKAGAGKADAGKASREPSAWNTTSGETAAGSSASTSTAPASQGPTARAAPSNAAGPYNFPYVPYTLVPDGKFGAFKPGHTLGRVVEVGMSADASMLAITHWLPHVVAAGYEDEVVNLTIETVFVRTEDGGYRPTASGAPDLRRLNVRASQPFEIEVQPRKGPTTLSGKVFDPAKTRLAVFGVSSLIHNVVDFESRQDVPWVQLQVFDVSGAAADVLDLSTGVAETVPGATGLKRMRALHTRIRAGASHNISAAFNVDSTLLVIAGYDWVETVSLDTWAAERRFHIDALILHPVDQTMCPRGLPQVFAYRKKDITAQMIERGAPWKVLPPRTVEERPQALARVTAESGVGSVPDSVPESCPPSPRRDGAGGPAEAWPDPALSSRASQEDSEPAGVARHALAAPTALAPALHARMGPRLTWAESEDADEERVAGRGDGERAARLTDPPVMGSRQGDEATGQGGKSSEGQRTGLREQSNDAEDPSTGPQRTATVVPNGGAGVPTADHEGRQASRVPSRQASATAGPLAKGPPGPAPIVRRDRGASGTLPPLPGSLSDRALLLDGAIDSAGPMAESALPALSAREPSGTVTPSDRRGALGSAGESLLGDRGGPEDAEEYLGSTWVDSDGAGSKAGSTRGRNAGARPREGTALSVSMSVAPRRTAHHSAPGIANGRGSAVADGDGAGAAGARAQPQGDPAGDGRSPQPRTADAQQGAEPARGPGGEAPQDHVARAGTAVKWRGVDGEEDRSREVATWLVYQIDPATGTATFVAPAPSASSEDFLRMQGRGDAVFQARALASERAPRPHVEVPPVGVQVLSSNSVAVYRVKSTNYTIRLGDNNHNDPDIRDVTSRNSFAILTRAAPQDYSGWDAEEVVGNIELPFNRLTSHAFPPVLTYDGVAPSRTTVDWLILQGGSGAIAIYSHAIVLVSAACAVGHFMPGAWVDATQWMYRIWDDQRMKLTARLGRQWNKLFQRSFLILLNRTRRAALQGLFYYAPEMLLARSTCGAPFVSRVMEYTREAVDVFDPYELDPKRRFRVAQPTLILLKEIFEGLQLWKKFMHKRLKLMPGAGWKALVVDSMSPLACVDNLLEGMGAENALQLAQCLVRCMEQRILVDDGSMHRTLQRVMHTLLRDPTDTVLRYLDMLVVKRPETVPASALMKDLNLATRAEQNTRVTLESYTNVMTPLTQPMVIPVQGKTPSDRDHRVGIEIPLHRRLWLALKLIAPIMAYDPQRGETRLRRALCSKSRALRIIFDPMEFRRLLASETDWSMDDLIVFEQAAKGHAAHRSSWGRQTVQVLQCVISDIVAPTHDHKHPSWFQEINRSGTHIEVYDMPIVQFLIQAKWEAYGARMAFYEGALHIVMVAAYMTYGGMLPTAIYVPAPGQAEPSLSTRSGKSSAATAFIACVLLIGGRLLRRKVRQFKWFGASRLIRSRWDINDLLVLSLLIATVVLHFQFLLQPSLKAARGLSAVVALEILTLWFGLLQYGLSMDRTGPLIRMIFEITINTRFFILVIAGMIAGFSFAFYLLFAETAAQSPRGSDVGDNFATLPRSLVTVVSMAVGGFDQLIFWETPLAALAVVLFIAFIALVLILLLNLLIAIMSDTYDKVKQSERLHLLRERAMLIEELEASMGRCQRQDLARRLPPNLAVFVPSTGPQRKRDNDERLAAIEEMVGKIWRRLRRIERGAAGAAGHGGGGHEGEGDGEGEGEEDDGDEEGQPGRTLAAELDPAVVSQLLMLYNMVRGGGASGGGGGGVGHAAAGIAHAAPHPRPAKSTVEGSGGHAHGHGHTGWERLAHVHHVSSGESGAHAAQGPSHGQAPPS